MWLDDLRKIAQLHTPMFIGIGQTGDTLNLVVASYDADDNFEIKLLQTLGRDSSDFDVKQFYNYTKESSWTCAVLPAPDVIMARHKEHAFLSSKEQQGARSLEHLFPCPMHDLTVRVVGSDLIAAAKTESVKAFEARLKQQHIFADTIFCEPLAIAALWHYLEDKPTEIIYWVYLTPSYTCCVVANQNKLLTCATVPIGLDNLQDQTENKNTAWNKQVGYFLTTWHLLFPCSEPNLYLFGAGQENDSLKESLQAFSTEENIKFLPLKTTLVQVEIEIFEQFATSLGCIAAMQQKRSPSINFALYYPKLSKQRTRNIALQLVQLLFIYSAAIGLLLTINNALFKTATEQRLSQCSADISSAAPLNWQHIKKEISNKQEQKQKIQRRNQQAWLVTKQLINRLAHSKTVQNKWLLDSFCSHPNNKDKVQISLTLHSIGEPAQNMQNELKQKIGELKLIAPLITKTEANVYDITFEIN